MERYFCIHGHFYQPPRENPWLEDIELQDSAYPYHDWNERINAECYAPNTAARILNKEGLIKKIVNNYNKISFNFGPTLLDWMEKSAPDVYRDIIEADHESRYNFSGHGSALAQAYNHMIMPLANRRDKYTQIFWGIKDFVKRFDRHPEGMWLPETAVDLDTLDIMAEQGISFTILTQYQARRVRKIGGNDWQEAGNRGIDPSMAYQLRIPTSGRIINIFFYDGPISQAVAFDHLLSNGERFAQRLMDGFSQSHSRPQLIHIATDGETYGHHHRHGEMALAYALDYIETNKLARITNYGEFLEKYPPTHEVEIHENTAWSCAHGVERWQNNCGCSTGMNSEWSQAWRAPLRQSLDWLRDTLAPLYEKYTQEYLKDPWDARNQYIDTILDRSLENQDDFLSKHTNRKLNTMEQVTVLKLLEMQRHAMLMYTSCGWFFDEISGIETIQALQYARRVIQLAQELFKKPFEPHFLEILALAKSNIPKHRNGAHLYKKLIKSKMVDLSKVGAHYAISSLFENYDKYTHIFCYTAHKLDNQTLVTGEAKLAVGQARIISQITQESAIVSYGVVSFGNHNINGAAKVFNNINSYREMKQEVTEAFNQADLPRVIRLLDQHFGKNAIYSLKQLFRDQQRKILTLILDSTMTELESDYRKIYNRHYPLMRFLKELGIPLPHALLCASDFYLNIGLRRSLANTELDLEHIATLLKKAETLDVNLDSPGLGYVLEKSIERLALQLESNPSDASLLKTLNKAANLARSLPFEINLWKVQNIYYRLLQTVYPNLREIEEHGDQATRAWNISFTSLGEKLLIQI